MTTASKPFSSPWVPVGRRDRPAGDGADLFDNYAPLGFEAGDANLYRYVSNSPTNLVDPSGLDFKFAGEKMTLSVQLQVKWVDGKDQKWTKEQREAFMAEFKKQVEAIWNHHPFVLVSKDDKKNYLPQVEIAFVDTFTNTDHKYNLEVYKDPLEGTVAFVKGNTLQTSAANALKPYTYQFIPQQGAKPIPIEGSIAAHEFGHLIGLPHPGAFAANPEELIPVYSKDTSTIEAGAVKGANSPAAYEADVFAVMGRGTELRWWMFTSWIDYLNENQKDGAPWRVGSNPKHEKYKSFYENWEKYCLNRLDRFAKAGLPKLTTFEQK
jgi:predicted Zn-dependent protease